MFGLDLEGYIEENITFTNNGSRPNQDIYYNIEDDKFWTHVYCGNESLSPDAEKENILVYSIKNTDEFHMICEYCDGNDDKWEEDCPLWQECQAELLYDDIRTICYDPQENIYQQISMYHLDNCHIDELVEIDKLLEESYGQYHEFINKSFNSTLSVDLKDSIIDDILDCGFGDGVDDGWLDGHCQTLVMKYEHIEDEKLELILELLGYCKIVEALKVLKAS